MNSPRIRTRSTSAKPKATAPKPKSRRGRNRRAPLTPTLLRALASGGHTVSSAAKALDVARASLQRRMRANPQLRDAWAQGGADFVARVAAATAEAMRSHPVLLAPLGVLLRLAGPAMTQDQLRDVEVRLAAIYADCAAREAERRGEAPATSA